MNTTNRFLALGTVTAIMLTCLPMSVSAVTVLTDGYAWGGTTPNELQGDINIDIPARQTGLTPTTYTPSYTNPVAGVITALENNSSALAGGPDDLFLRVQTSGTGTVHNQVISLDANFTALTGQQWTLDYTARLANGGAVLNDIFFGLGFGTTASPTGPAADGFFFALRQNGDWLLWRNSAANFTSGSLFGWTSQQEYSVGINVDETSSPTLSLAVTPLGGSE